MVVLLVAVNARYSHSCLALYSLKRALREAVPEEVCHQEWSINKPVAETAAAILAADPDVIGFSCYIWNIRYILAVIAAVKRQKPQIKIILGGPEAGSRAEALLEAEPAVDYIIRGEGERTLPLLLRQIGDKRAPAPLSGVFYREAGLVKSGPPAQALDLAALPFPYSQEDLLALKQHILYYESSRGCPFACSYCFSGHEAPRLRPLAQVRDDLRQILAADIRQVKFVDRTFNWPPERARQIVSFLLEHYRPGICFHMEMAPDLLDAPLLALLRQARPGFFQVEAGIQSTYAPALAAVRRHMDWAKVCAAIAALLKPGNVHVHLDLIAGLPEENYARFAESFRQVYALGAHRLQLGFLKILPGSALAAEAAARGLCHAQEPPYQIRRTPHMSGIELRRLEEIAGALDMFYNSGRFAPVLSAAVRQYGDAFAFYESLAVFLGEEAEYPRYLPDQYAALYGFCASLWPKQAAYWRERFGAHWRQTVRSAKMPAVLQEK